MLRIVAGSPRHWHSELFQTLSIEASNSSIQSLDSKRSLSKLLFQQTSPDDFDLEYLEYRPIRNVYTLYRHPILQHR